MKTAVAIVWLVLFATTAAFGQATNQQAHKGRVKIWTGVGLLAAGLFVVPVTAAGHTSSYDPPVVGAALVAAGGSLIWWGVRDQRKAARPSTTFGVMLGRNSGIHIRRGW
jgi:hypothetical protein